MKIDMSFERLCTGKVQQESISPKIKNNKIAENDNSQQTQNFSRSKAIVDAVVINQIAQSFFQKAIMISSRLKSIASEAQTGGNIKNEELNVTLNSINSSLNEIQEQASGPVGHAQDNIMLHTGVTVSVPQINDEVKAMKNFSGDILSGRVDLINKPSLDPIIPLIILFPSKDFRNFTSIFSFASL